MGGIAHINGLPIGRKSEDQVAVLRLNVTAVYPRAIRLP